MKSKLHPNFKSEDEIINDNPIGATSERLRVDRLKTTLSHESLTSSLYAASKTGHGFNTHDMKSIISSWETPLHNAAAEGRCDELNLLLSYPQVDINIQTKRYNEYDGLIILDNTPLHLAAKNGREKAVDLLLKGGATCDIQNSNGATPLHLATLNGASIEIVQNLVLDRTTISIKDDKGKTALFCAAEEGWHNLIPILVNAGESIEEKDNSGETPLIAATKNGFSQTMKILQELGAYISNRDKLGRNALEYALLCDERTIQDEEVFDKILSVMLRSQSKDIALSHLPNLLGKYSRLKLKQSIVSLFKRIPMQRARKVIIYSKYLESDKQGFTPDQDEFQHRSVTALQMIADTREEDFAFHPSIRIIVDKKMQRIGYYLLSIEIAYFLFFLFCLGFIFITAAGSPNPHIYNSTIDYMRGCFEVLAAISWIIYVFAYVLGVVTEVTRVYQNALVTSNCEKKLKKETSINRIFLRTVQSLSRDTYNYFSILFVVCLFLVPPLRFIASSAQWIFAASAVVFGFLRTIKVIRLLPGLGTYVHTITLIMFYDVPKFLVVCFMVIMVFSECFYLSLRAPYGNSVDNLSTEQLGEEGLFDTYYWTTLLFLRMLLQGENILEHNYLSNHLNWLSTLIYLCSLMLIILILLNIFIAQVSDTYTAAKSKSEKVVALYRLEYIVHSTLRTFGFSRKKGYIQEIVLKGNEWRSVNKDSDDMYTDIQSLVTKQQSNLEQLKQSIISLRKIAQSSSNDAASSRASTPDSEH